MAIQNYTVSNSSTTIFSCPGNVSTDPQEHAVTCVIFCNTSASEAELTVHAVSYPNARSSTNMIINSLIVPAGETFTFDTEKLVLSTGDTIQAISSVDGALSATVSSMRVS
jgi:hypothetical protein